MSLGPIHIHVLGASLSDLWTYSEEISQVNYVQRHSSSCFSYAPVICIPDSPGAGDSGDIAGLKCLALTAVPRICRGYDFPPIHCHNNYTPGIYADGYIVFAFQFVRSYVR